MKAIKTANDEENEEEDVEGTKKTKNNQKVNQTFYKKHTF